MQFKNMRKIAIVLAALMVISTVSVSAEWFFAGYDTTNLDNIGKIYNEKIDGKYTNKSKIDPIDYDDVEWKAEGFELAYPHAGYDRLYIEGNAQAITRYNNLFPQWETRLKDYMWELCGDHRIYQRQQTNIPGKGWTWDYSENDAIDAKLFTKTTRFADTVDSFKTVGFADLDLEGFKLDPEDKEDKKIIDMNKYFGTYVTVEEMLEATIWTPAGEYFNGEEFVQVPAGVKKVFDPITLSLLDETGHFILSDEVIAEYVASIQTKFVTGPALDSEGTITKDVAAAYLANENRANWHWDVDTVRFGGGEVAWTDCTYEIDDKYAYYQFLVVNGVVCDGRNDTPYIYRRTGGKATPVVEWKFLSWEETNELGISTANGPLDILEWKFVDGKPTFHEDGTPIVRIPTGEYANCYIKVTDTEIQLWRETGRDADEMISAVSRVGHPLGGFIDAYVPEVDLFRVSDASGHLADYPATIGHCN